MRAILPILLACALMPFTVVADHDGRPHDAKSPCQNDREKSTCTDVLAGEMSCLPYAGTANDLSFVVGSADQGTFQLKALGTNHLDSDSACLFEIRIRANEIQFNEGYAPGILAPYGGASGVTSQACLTIPGESCETTATFTWWRAQHGVTFDVPYDLYVNGVLVDSGRCHYYDPPMLEEVTGGPVTL